MTQLTVRQSTNLLKKHLKELYNCKFSVKTDSFSMGSSLDCEYDLGPDKETIENIIKRLQYGYVNSMEDMTEIKNENEYGYKVNGVELQTYKYTSTRQYIPKELTLRLCQAFNEVVNIAAELPTLETINDLYTSFQGDAWNWATNWANLLHRYFKVRNFSVQNEELIEDIKCHYVDHDNGLNDGVYFTYTVEGVQYDTRTYKAHNAKPTKKQADKKTASSSGSKANDLQEIIADCDGVQVVNYSDKSIAVFGPTYDIKDELKAAGGKFNRFLTYNGNKCAGWVFSKNNIDEVTKIVTELQPA